MSEWKLNPDYDPNTPPPPTEEEFEAQDAWDRGNEIPYSLRVEADRGLWFEAADHAIVLHLTEKGAALVKRTLMEIDARRDRRPWDADRFPSVKAFARYMLEHDRLLMRPIPELIEADEIATRMVLFREGPWQIELVVGRPGAVLKPHCHDHVESMHLVIGDSGGSAEIDGRTFQWRGHRGPLAANLVHVPKGAAHSGVGGAHGSAFIAFQKWDVAPGFVRHDWRDAA